MKRVFTRFSPFVLALTIVISCNCAFASQPYKLDSAIYSAMVRLQSTYPEGTPWTNSTYYGWKGGLYSGGYGCFGFACMLSDAAFGALPARQIFDFQFADVRPGDILRINNDTHSVIVLEVHANHVVIAEGNYNYSVHWFRTLSANAVEQADYLMTRYPTHTPILTHNTIVSDWAVPYTSKADALGLIVENLGLDYARPITRSQFCALAVNLFQTIRHHEMWYATSKFADADDINMAKAFSYGIISGYNTGSTPNEINVGPNDLITREQVAVILCHIADALRVKLPTRESRFNDGISSWAKSSINSVYGAGLMSGYSETQFGPQDYCSIEQSITTILHMWDYYATL